MSVPDQGRAGTFVLQFTQALTVVDVATKKGTRAGVVQKLVPRKGPSGSPDFFPNANPRVILSSVSAGQGGVHSVAIDLTFIDVTTRRARIDPNNQFASQQIAGARPSSRRTTSSRWAMASGASYASTNTPGTDRAFGA